MSQSECKIVSISNSHDEDQTWPLAHEGTKPEPAVSRPHLQIVKLDAIPLRPEREHAMRVCIILDRS